MKLKRVEEANIVNNNLATLKSHEKTVLASTPYYDLLAVIADMFDSIAKGDNAYLTLGATSNRSAFSVTVHLGIDKDARYAGTLADLCAGAADWL